MEFYRDAAAGNSLVSVDAGKRLLESKSKYKELNGVAATAYLEKAETMFREMGAIIGWYNVSAPVGQNALKKVVGCPTES